MHREIGEGGMARVFLGTQLSLSREVAIKVLRPELDVEGQDFKARFLHEGRMLATLVHPNIVAIYDIGENEDYSYMAMEFLQGGTLNQRVREGLSVAEVIRITTQVAHALDLAHRNHIVHRDLKPSNIMFRDELTPVLTDFGIAKKTDTEHSLTKTGMVVGTPYYMSPEQITGRDIDGRSDIYSLGIMFYELLVGELPFRAEEPLALAMQHVQEPPPQLPDDFEELQPIMDMLLAKSADDRFQSMLDFVAAVKELVMTDEVFAAKLSGETKLFDSEQFSDPRFTSRTGRVSRTSGKLKTKNTKQRKPAAGGATAVLRTGQGKAAKAGMGWKIPAIAAVLAIGIGGGIVYTQFMGGERFEGELTEEQLAQINTNLERARSFVTVKFYDAPPGNNAVEELQQIFAIAPGYPEAVEIAEEVAKYYEAEATAALATGDLDLANANIEKGVALAPSYEPIAALREAVAAQVADVERRARIDDLAARGEAAEQAGQLFEPVGEDAYTLYQEVLKLDAANQMAIAGLGRMQDKLIGDARAALAAGDTEGAAGLAVQARERFGNDSSVASILRQVNEINNSRLAEEQVAQLLQDGQQLLAEGSYVQPAGVSNNALETFQAVLGLSAGEPAAIAGLETIASHFETEARTAFDAGDFLGSADFASLGLRAVPDNEPLLAIQSEATGRLDDRARQIEQNLQIAERLAAEGQFLSGDEGGAKAAYERVLELSPTNFRATAALGQLPEQVYTAAVQLQRDGYLQAASALLTEAVSAYPTEARYGDLLGGVESQLADQQRRLRLDQLLAEVTRLVEVRPVTQASFDAAASRLKEVLTEYPNNVRVRSQLSALTGSLAQEADRISAQQGNHDAALRLIEAGLTQFDGNETLLTGRTGVADRRAAQLEAERQRILAMTGRLAIDAMPWGEVVEIVDASGNPADLPPDATTPLVIPLIEGDYSVTVRGANGGAPQRIEVNVQRQRVVTARAEFTGMSADDYFETSGW
ncbi:MAG: protein kinase [Pseudomonadota bacterium]